MNVVGTGPNPLLNKIKSQFEKAGMDPETATENDYKYNYSKDPSDLDTNNEKGKSNYNGPDTDPPPLNLDE